MGLVRKQKIVVMVSKVDFDPRDQFVFLRVRWLIISDGRLKSNRWVLLSLRVLELQ